MAKKGTRQRTIKVRRRRGFLAFVIPWLRRFGIALGVLVTVIWLGAWFFLTDADTRTAEWIKNKTMQASVDMGFSVQEVLLEGRINTDAQVVDALINIRQGDPLFSFDPDEAKKLIERISWVKAAHVERRLPSTIYIELEERQPLALWQQDQKLKLLDTDGKVITDQGLDKFMNLLVVTGKEAPEHTAELIRNLQAEELLVEHVRSARWTGNRRWDLTLDTGTIVKLPEEDIGLALRRLVRTEEDDKILSKDLRSIDLREDDRIVVRTKPGALQEYKAKAKAGDNI